MMFPIYLYIAILLLVALLSTRLMKVVKMPNVTGYIITGILMGPFVFGLLFNHFSFSDIKASVINTYVSQIGWISTVALGFIAFSIGSSFKVYTLRKIGKKVIVITVLESLFASICVILATLVLHFIIPNIVTIETVLVLGAIAAATAPAATLMVIKQYKARGEFVDTLLPVVALDDASALILFSLLFQIATAISSGGTFSFYKMMIKPLLEILMSVAFGAVIGFLISFINRFFNSRNNKLILCIFSIFLSIGVYYIFKEPSMGEFELSSLLMCMVSGTIYTNIIKDSGKTFDLMERFTSPIYMMFFVLAGASLDLTIFTSKLGIFMLIIALVYIVFRVVGKWLGSFTGATITKADEKIRKYLGIALIPQAGVAIGLANNAKVLFSRSVETQEIGNTILAIVLTTTLVYELVGPFAAKFALTKAGAIEKEEVPQKK